MMVANLLLCAILSLMGRLSKPDPPETISPMKLAVVMYAARNAAKEIDQHLGMLAIGMKANVLSRDLSRTLEILKERLEELS
jgi:hypothetical protein